jgi:hypothetical protein
MRLVINCIFIWLLSGFSQHAEAQCNINKISSFQPGEKIKFKAYYHLLWDTYAADVQFSVSQKTHQEAPVYSFQAIGATIKKFDWVYKVCDRFQSHVSMNTFNPVWAKRETSEDNYVAVENYSFVSNGKKIYTEVQNSDHPYKRDSLTMNCCAFDVLTLVYYCRTIDFSQCKKNDKIPVNVIVDGNIYPIYIRYRKKEVIKNKFDDKKYRCILLSVLCLKGSIFDGGENLKIWVTDDENKVPIKIQAKIQVGTVFGYVNEMEGLRNKVNAIVN